MNSLFNVSGPDEFAQLREILRQTGFNEKGLIDLLGPIQLPTRAGRDLPHFLHLTRALRPVDVAVRLFLIGVPVDDSAARKTLAPMALEDWEQIGLIRRREGAVTGRVRMLPFRGMLLACDYADPLGPGGQLEQVMGLTASSVALADFTVRRPSGSTLDLGTGNGIQAFAAAPHSRRVCGVDRSGRSIEFARFNAGLNSIANCEFLAGDAFEPVRGRTFDLVISNPPFAITPSMRYMYRDSGMELDSFCRNLARQAPAFLNEGGVFQMCCDWAHMAGVDWKGRLARWFEGSGCDAWVLRMETHRTGDYARIWVRDTENENDQATGRLYDEWMAFYEAQGVEAISTGLVAMRRTSGRANWLRMEDLPEGTVGPVGDSVALGFEVHDYLETARNDEALLGERLRVSTLARLEQSLAPDAGGWRGTSARIHLTGGLAYSSPIDMRLAGLIANCDGHRPVRELLAGLAQTTGADLQKITPNCLALLRQLIERGFLLSSS